MDKLRILPSGLFSSNPAELLFNNGFEEILLKMKKGI